MKQRAKACGYSLSELRQAYRGNYLDWPPVPSNGEISSSIRRMLLGQPPRSGGQRGGV
jgi:hypothetical protein